MSKAQNRKDYARRKARRCLGEVLERWGHACRWCGRPLVLLRDLRSRCTILSLDSRRVSWLEGGTVRRELLATADHLVPLRDGGTSDPGNLVPACYDCNKDRTAAPRACRTVCCKCGGQKPGDRRRTCEACRLGGLSISTVPAPVFTSGENTGAVNSSGGNYGCR